MTQCFPIDQVLLFATKRNGTTLPREGGYPLRAVAPGEYGYKSVKWVRKIKFTEKRELDSNDLGSIRWSIDLIPPEENPWNCDNDTRKKLLKKIFLESTSGRKAKEGRGGIAKRIQTKGVNQLPKKEEEIFLCNENEIPEGKSKRFESFGQKLLVFKLNGVISAIESICPHVFQT